MGGQAGMVEGAAERRIDKAARRQRLAIGRQKGLKRGGAGLFGADLQNGLAGHARLTPR
ncbi:hypothetical protein JMJ94_12375 [Rhodovulum visakhapatnamense]|nr:hypothetical protein [Rhodovulum visakhapatnamense]